ncbi:hypothetical protein F1D05_09525 [Kribbella qitaiheensis]|uniref:Uncharacterized protein n=1 Tax=Kribbella qitaiheensis TaxID=1544730 RepID=A0A7G6X9D9_9ACTN|nr:hypothetical protein F1D05_09525 [Kribbella qitaiheensis]
MNRICETAVVALTQAQMSLPDAAWDVKSFLENAKTYLQTIGGLALMLGGAAGLVWGGFRLLQKLMGGQQHGQGDGWGRIAALILVGGALGTGGWSLISAVGSGGQTTIEDLGGGTIIVAPGPLEGR